MKARSFTAEFVEYIPDALQAGVLYISMKHATAAHLCACGCGEEVSTPLSPTDWQLYFDGVAVTLEPSIGNWSYDCRSHYLIRAGRVRWAGGMTQYQIESARAKDRLRKQRQFDSAASVPKQLASAPDLAQARQAAGSFGRWLPSWLRTKL